MNETEGLAQDICSKYTGVFKKDLGCAVDFHADLYLKEGAVPKFFKPRKLNYVQKAKVEAEIKRLVESSSSVVQLFAERREPISLRTILY